jgi:hypothetical protein
LFSGDGDASELRLAHSGWHAGQAADRAKFDDEGGWSAVLDAYRRYAAA